MNLSILSGNKLFIGKYKDKAIENVIKFILAIGNCPADAGLKDIDTCAGIAGKPQCFECWQKALQQEPEEEG